jgi:hypothetical protein
MPEFESDAEMTSWFESASLDDYELDDALEVEVSGRIGLIVDEPWTIVVGAGVATTTSGHITELVSS